MCQKHVIFNKKRLYKMFVHRAKKCCLVSTVWMTLKLLWIVLIEHWVIDYALGHLICLTGVFESCNKQFPLHLHSNQLSSLLTIWALLYSKKWPLAFRCRWTAELDPLCKQADCYFGGSCFVYVVPLDDVWRCITVGSRNKKKKQQQRKQLKLNQAVDYR